MGKAVDRLAFISEDEQKRFQIEMIERFEDEEYRKSLYKEFNIR